MALGAHLSELSPSLFFLMLWEGKLSAISILTPPQLCHEDDILVANSL
jgi:hypothetical protein